MWQDFWDAFIYFPDGSFKCLPFRWGPGRLSLQAGVQNGPMVCSHRSHLRGSTPSQCASACLKSTYGECSGFSFHPLSEDHEKCKLYSESVFTKNDTETAAVGWCPKGGSTFYHVCSKEFCFQILLQAIVSLRQIWRWTKEKRSQWQQQQPQQPRHHRQISPHQVIGKKAILSRTSLPYMIITTQMR